MTAYRNDTRTINLESTILVMRYKVKRISSISYYIVLEYSSDVTLRSYFTTVYAHSKLPLANPKVV